MKKIIFFMFAFFNINVCFTSFGFSRWSATNLNGEENRVYYGEVVYSEVSRDVKMRQDDEYYYFDIKQDVVAPFSDSNYMITRFDGGYRRYSTFNNGANMQIVLAPFSNISELTYRVVENEDVYIESSGFNKGTQICNINANKWHIYSPKRMYYNINNNDIGVYTSNDRSYPMVYYIDGSIRGQVMFTGWVEKNGKGGPDTRSGYVSYNIPKLHDDDPNIPLTLPQVVSKSCECVRYRDQESPNTHFYYVYEVQNVFRYTVKIKKDSLDIWDENGYNVSPFRFCNVVSKGNFDEADSSRTYPYGTSINNSIDLSLYLKCDHKWMYRDDSNREHHTRYCSKCMWEKVEKHDFIYEYDGILNDRCICGIKKNVYITIKDNIGKINERILTTPSCSLHNVEWESVGYDFLNVTDKELLYDNATGYKYVISTMSDIPRVVPDNSHEYNINYYIHKYYVHFNKTNNLNLSIDNTMSPQVIEYGKKVKLDKSLYNMTGYTFLGWAIEPDLSTAVLADEKEMYNISDEDGYVLNLYPVYDPYRYIIRFTSGRGEGHMEDQVGTYGICENIKGYGYRLDNEAVFVSWQYNGKDISPSVTATLEPYIKNNNDVITLQANIYVRERNEEASWEHSPTKKPDGAKINTEVGPGIKETEKPKEDVAIVVNNNITNNEKTDKKEDDDDEDEDDNNDDENEYIYIKLATNSAVNRVESSGDIGKNNLFYGALLAVSIIGKMAFCMVFVLILVIFLATIIYGRKKIKEYIKKYI